MTKRRAGALDNRNLGNRVTIEFEAGTYYGILEGMWRKPNAGTTEDPGTVVLNFRDGSSFEVGFQHTVDTTITGWELTVMDIHKELRRLARPAAGYTPRQSQEIVDWGGGS